LFGKIELAGGSAMPLKRVLVPPIAGRYVFLVIALLNAGMFLTYFLFGGKK